MATHIECPEGASEEIKRLHRALRTLSGSNHALLRAEDEESLLAEICRVVVEESGYRFAWVSYAEDDLDKTLRPVAHAGCDESFLSFKRTWSDADERGRGPNPTAVRTGKLCIIQNVQRDETYAYWREEAIKRGFGSVIALPLHVEGKVIGALSIFAAEHDAFDEREVRLLEEASEDLAYGIEILRGRKARRQAEVKLSRLNRAYRTLGAANHAVLHATNEKDLLKQICTVVVEEAGYRMAFVSYILHDESMSVQVMAHAGFEEGFLDTLNLTWDETKPGGRGATGTALRTGRVHVVRVTDPEAAPWKTEGRARGYEAAIGLPLHVGDEVIGCLTIMAAELEAFDAGEVQLLIQTADDLSHGIDALRIQAKARRADEVIRRMAYYDSLTGLPNRILLRERLEDVVALSKGENRPLALLHLDVGHFQEINETLGYKEGDRLLQEIATRLTEVVGDSESVARVSENEFAILLPRAGADRAIQVSQKILISLYEPVELGGVMVDARASIGIALFPGHGTDPDVLIRRANIALYHGKRSGNGYAIYTGGLDSDHAKRLALMGDLRRAIDNNELLLYCQPKVNIRTKQVCGVEALVRWQHPEHGLLNPGEFLKLAESTGLITPLTYWVLDSAMRQSYAWREAGWEQPMAVNLSARDLRDPKLLDRIAGSFSTWGIEPESIQFELTESALMEDPVGALAILRRLKNQGMQIFVDDFGTGYSSLAYLQKLPVFAIKIDQSFVSKMTSNEDSAVIVRSTVELAHNLALEVVAEGVDNTDAMNQLAQLGCDMAQGFLISRPIPADEMPAWDTTSLWREGLQTSLS